ncbi:MAG: glycosyltransferase, partial [Thermodesulfobacteriota bacterium]
MRAAVAPFPRRLRDNPYCELLYGHLARIGVPVVSEPELSPGWLWRHRDEVGVVHLHWPEFYYREPGGGVSPRSLAAFALGVTTAAALGYRLVWTVHNAQPHEASRADRLVRALLLRIATPIVHSQAALDELGPAASEAAVIPHGSYVGWYPDVVSRAEARERLGIERQARVLLWFGQVRPYKALAPLLYAVHDLPHPDVRLVVAGRPVTPGAASEVGDLARFLGDTRLHLHLRHVPDDEVQLFFRACDLVVLPYRQVLTSGAAILAASFGRGLVVPRLGALRDFEEAGCAIGYDADVPGALNRALEHALDADVEHLGRRARALADGLGWDRIAAA